MKKRYNNNEEYRAAEQERTKLFRREKYRTNEEFRQKESIDATQRRKLIKLQTPKWVNMDDIKQIYKDRPEGHHVDHIVPLQGDNVSGLHVPWNLQHLPREENLKKSNKF